ncbi:MAG: hypothetical protein JWP97_6765 [Labilithrix sp.]|nr:hypothetical protein [Labilithrix sp.]
MEQPRPTPPRPLAFQAFTPEAFPPAAIGETTLRETSGPFEVALAAPPPPAAPAPPVTARPVSLAFVGETERSGVSKQELLARAAALGPSRMTWESIVLPDPVLDEKRQPHVAERRERFTRMVKLGLAACLGVCVLALGVTAATGSPSASAAAAEPASAAGTVPSKSVTPVESLGGVRHGKAPRRTTTPVSTARAKRR